MGIAPVPQNRNFFSTFQYCIFLVTATLIIFLVQSQDIDLNCDPNDPNCVCIDVANESTCFCDWGYVLDPEYQPSIGRMKFCTKFCTGGYLNCWTTTTSRALCGVDQENCVCAFGYTARLATNLQVICQAVNCHKRYLLDDNELCNCPDFSVTSDETQCNCVAGYVGNVTTHPGFCKGFQCTPGSNSYCYCHDGPSNPTSCECQTKATDTDTRYSFLVNGGTERKCMEGKVCPLGQALDSTMDNTTRCLHDVCVKGSPFCDTGSVYRFCEDGYTANWDLTCIPIECNDRILNTDVSFCTCADGVQDNGRVLEQKCRCFTGYVSDFEKPGQCRKLCDIDMDHCLSSADQHQCTASNNQNCECAEGFQTVLLDTNKVGEVVNLDADGRLIHKGQDGYISQISGYKVGCVPECNPIFDDNCKKQGDETVRCDPGYAADWNQICQKYECNAGFSPEIYHCDCDQDAYGSATLGEPGFIEAKASEFPLTCFCLSGYVSAFLFTQRFCKEQVCDPYNDEFCEAAAQLDGTYLLDTSRCKQNYFALRDLSHDTDPEDEMDEWKGDHLPQCVHVVNITYCDPGTDDGCDAVTNECKYSLGYTPINGKCYRLTCDLDIVTAQYPDGTGYQMPRQICTKQFSVDFNNDNLYFCTPGFYPNGTGGCNVECNTYFSNCTKYDDETYIQCMFGFAPNMFVTSEGFRVDHTCIVNECNSVKEHCVCPSWYGQTKVKIEKDCECEMGYAPDGIGGCQKICYREGYELGETKGTEHCNSKCIGPVCVCDPGYSLIYNWFTEQFICHEITCHKGNENCDCGEDPDDPEAIRYIEEVECQCVNGTKPLSDGTCTTPVLDQCVTCSSDDELNACVSEVEINGIRGITTKDCDKHTGYFGCWVEEYSRKNGSYFFSRGCGYYCTDSYLNNTYCFYNQKNTPEEERICRSCCMYGENCNIIEIKNISSTIDTNLGLLLAAVYVLGVSILTKKTFLAPDI